MNNNQFRLDIIGDLDYEDLIADIYFNDNIVATLTQEEGFENLRIQFYGPKNQECWDFRFDEFDSILQKAKKRLYDLRKENNYDDSLED